LTQELLRGVLDALRSQRRAGVRDEVAGRELAAGPRLVRREPGQMTTVAAVDQAEDVAYLAEQRDRHKLHAFTSARSELLFGRRVLLVEGPGDAAAAKLCAAGLGLDLDAEDLSVVECGGKSAIPFIASVCRALAIPYCVRRGRLVAARGANTSQPNPRRE
jgi:acetaldehyde dehydrogenase (acetylating)